MFTKEDGSNIFCVAEQKVKITPLQMKKAYKNSRPDGPTPFLKGQYPHFTFLVWTLDCSTAIKFTNLSGDTKIKKKEDLSITSGKTFKKYKEVAKTSNDR